MGEHGKIAGTIEGPSTALVKEKGSRNKRKFLSNLSIDIPVDVTTLSRTEFPRHEMLQEKFQNALSNLGSLIAGSADASEEQEFQEFQEADWDNPIACQLEELLTNNLLATFRSAIKQIEECGYTEEAAEWAVLNSGLYHGIKDAVSNVVDGALALLSEKEFNTSNRPLFGGLQNLVDYTILEMIHVLREVRPALTVAEAMWYLLISDTNLVNACVMEGVTSGSSCVPESPGESSVATIFRSKDGVSVNSHLGSKTCDDPKQLMPCAQSSQLESPISVPVHQFPNSKNRAGELGSIVKEGSVAPQEVKGKFSAITREKIQTSSQSMTVDERSGGTKKGPSGSSKRDLLRQKTFQFEKSYKGRMSKGAFKAKVAAWGSMVLDKSSKSQSGSSVMMKGACSKVTGINDSIVEGKHHLSSNSQRDGPAGVLPIKDPVFALPAVISKSSASLVADPNSLSNGEPSVSGSHKSTDYFSAIAYDETLQKYVPQDDKDETILILVPHRKVLEKELQGWTHWANDKVMQAARRLGSDQGELKLLRQEKEETEKLNKERQTLEENTLKRLSEMENALSNASGQIEMANSAVRRLGEENSLLKKKMEDAKSQSLRAASNLQEAVRREQDALKKSQLWNAEKGLIQEQLTDLKRQTADLNNRLEKATVQMDQFKVLMKQEEKEKVKAATFIDSLRRKKEEDDAVTREEEDRIKQMGELNLQKCKEAIKNLESAVSELILESDKSKIAALNVGYGSCLNGGEDASTFPGLKLPKITKRLAVFQENFGAGNVRPERECIMCMTEEISVVFLPCAHQVLCGQCSNLHEKQGINDCPSCRTTIGKRISVGYRVN
ncbi:putative E3 ubiquitin-protein ligase RF298 [Primulina huaijiensis]|uniref:putative E3 ubiquitin-protein ligase RF298 n=1 Tax=Primulina huaijiensis TaxID=1492673 RepID=UPI003CC70C1C